MKQGIDDAFLIELLNPAEARRYGDFMNPAGCAAIFGPGERPAIAADEGQLGPAG
jgi:hypothetical protein